VNTSVRRLFDDLHTLRIVVIQPPGEDRDVLERQLRRIGCQIKTLWPFPSRLPGDADVIFFRVSPELRSAGNWCAADTTATLIALSDYENPTLLKLLLDTQAHGVITKPYRSSGILSTLLLAHASSGYQQRLGSKIRKLEDAIRARRHIDKAVRILMDAHRLSEGDAYEHMRSRATSLRVTVGEVANMVIDTREAMQKLGLGEVPKD
jgi:two-component system, response regulator PdtaR